MLVLIKVAQLESLTLVLAATVLAPVIALAHQFHTTNVLRLTQPASPRVGTLMKESVPYGFAVLVTNLFDRLDVFLILWFADFTVQGYYAVAKPAVTLLTVVPLALGLFSFNAGAKSDRHVTLPRVIGIGAALVAGQLLMAGAYALIMKPLMICVYGEAFRGAVPFGLALLAAGALNGCTVVAEGYLRGRNKPAIGIWGRLLGAVALLGSVALLFGTWKELSIPLAASIGQAVTMLFIISATLLDTWSRGKDSSSISESLQAPVRLEADR